MASKVSESGEGAVSALPGPGHSPPSGHGLLQTGPAREPCMQPGVGASF